MTKLIIHSYKTFFRATSTFVLLMCTGLAGCSLIVDRDPSALKKAPSSSNSQTLTGSNQGRDSQSRTQPINPNKEQQTAVPITSTRKNFGSIVIPGISLARWESNRDAAAWRDTQRPLVSLASNDNIIHNIAVSKNGAVMASIGAKINVWDINSLSLVRSWELDSIGNEVKLTPDGKFIVSAHEDNTVRIWQQETGFRTATLQHTRSISALAISPSGARIASSDESGNIHIWDIKTGRRLYSIDETLKISTLNFSPNGLWLVSSGIASDDINHTIQIWETRYYTLELSLPGHKSAVNHVDFSPDGKFIVTASRDNTVKIWDVAKGLLFRTLTGHTDDVVKTVFSNDGFWLMTSSLDNKVRIWTFPTGQPIKVIHTAYLRAESIQYVSSRNWLALIGGSNSSIEIWSSSGFTYKPWGDIRTRVNRLYQDRQKILTVPFISKPQLPSTSNLRKGTFESQITFVDRISKIYGQRINGQIIQYRRKVDERNRRVAILKQSQDDSRKLLNQDIRQIAIRTTRRVLGESVLFPLKIDDRPAYDPDRGIMTIRMSFTRAFYRENLVLRVPEGRPAEVFYDDLVAGKVTGNAVFDFVSESRIRVSRVEVNWRGQKLLAYPTQGSSGFKIIPAELKDVTLSPAQLQFQRYDIPYTNFNDFIRSLLREQLKQDMQAKLKEPTTDKAAKSILPDQ